MTASSTKSSDRPEPSPALTLDDILMRLPGQGSMFCHSCGKKHDMRPFATEMFAKIIEMLGQGRAVYIHNFCRFDPKYIPGRRDQRVGLDTVADGTITYEASIGVRCRLMPGAKKRINEMATSTTIRYVRAVYGTGDRSRRPPATPLSE